jgi:transcriptional regulator with XRE-family HTH domain
MEPTEYTAMQAARLRKGLTLRQLSEACADAGQSVDFGQLGRIERGEAVPRPALRVVIAQVLEIDPLELPG